jgi:HD superfamily phosphodiesterase
MKKPFNTIRDMALPYQDQRDDPGHAEVTLYYAQLLLRYEKGDRDIIIPAIILHDVGYSQIPKERRMKIFAREAKKIERLAVQYEHQIEGVLLARKILEKVNYPANMVAEILEIISQHDTRKGFISQNEGLTRDADKLWRYSRRCIEAGENRAKAKPQLKPKEPSDETKKKDPKRKRPDRWRMMKKGIEKPGYFYSERAKKIALKELKIRKKEAAQKPKESP